MEGQNPQPNTAMKDNSLSKVLWISAILLVLSYVSREILRSSDNFPFLLGIFILFGLSGIALLFGGIIKSERLYSKNKDHKFRYFSLTLLVILLAVLYIYIHSFDGILAFNW
jgi:hypothetical protein